METTLHGHHTLSGECAENEVAAVAFHCRHREIGYLAVRYHGLVLDKVGQGAETGAEYDCDAWHVGDFAAEIIGCLFDFF